MIVLKMPLSHSTIAAMQSITKLFYAKPNSLRGTARQQFDRSYSQSYSHWSLSYAVRSLAINAWRTFLNHRTILLLDLFRIESGQWWFDVSLLTLYRNLFYNFSYLQDETFAILVVLLLRPSVNHSRPSREAASLWPCEHGYIASKAHVFRCP